ncbi:MAG: fimbrillin family protein [Bacteroidales bacterium]|nr:fimbrillin family protein [Bacteroidales bacterium]
MKNEENLKTESRRDYALKKGRSLFLGGVLAASCLLASFPACILTSCDRSDFTPEVREDDDTTSFEMTLTKATGTVISSLDIYIFNDDSLKALDSHQRISPVTASKVRSTSRCGKKILFLVANIPEGRLEWAGTSRYEAFLSSFAQLTDESGEMPIMTAQTRFGTASEKNLKLTLKPMMAEVNVKTICCDFKGKPYEGEKLKKVRFYLTNVSGRCRFGDYEAPGVFLNSGRYDEREMEGMKDRNLLMHDYGFTVSTKKIWPLTSLHAYPNTNDGKTVGKPCTRLVIEGEIEGRTYYYPIDLRLEKNISYNYDITINRKGTLDPDIPIDPGMISVKCTARKWDEKETVMVPFSVKAKDTEDKISNLNLFIFDEEGLLEEKVYSRNGKMELKLLRGCRYDIYACANLGYALNLKTREEIEKYRYWIAYPDEFTEGIPMCGKLKGYEITGDALNMELERMMARIKVVADRTKLNPDVKLILTDARIGNCPRSAMLFTGSRAETTYDIFSTGYAETFGLKDSLTLYQMENLNGELDDPRKKLCSYIEIRAEYYSTLYYTKPGEYLRYRFYIRDSKGNYDVERNGSYRFVITPEGTGLNLDDSWRTDKSALAPNGS